MIFRDCCDWKKIFRKLDADFYLVKCYNFNSKKSRCVVLNFFFFRNYICMQIFKLNILLIQCKQMRIRFEAQKCSSGRKADRTGSSAIIDSEWKPIFQSRLWSLRWLWEWPSKAKAQQQIWTKTRNVFERREDYRGLNCALWSTKEFRALTYRVPNKGKLHKEKDKQKRQIYKKNLIWLAFVDEQLN